MCSQVDLAEKWQSGFEPAYGLVDSDDVDHPQRARVHVRRKETA